jgi:uncharacterized membrane protein (DUF485 family)
MLILLIILIIIILASIYLLFMPITVNVNIQIDNEITIIWGINVFPFEHRFSPGEPRIPREKKPKIEKPRPPKPEGQKPKFEALKFSRDDMRTILRVISNVVRLAGRLLKAPDQYYLHAALAGGLSAPDLTGEFFGAVQSVGPILPRAITISYKPDFFAEKINGKVSCGIVFRIFRIILEIIYFIFRLPLIKLFKLYRKYKKGG